MTPLFEERQRPPHGVTIFMLVLLLVAGVWGVYTSARLDRVLWDFFALLAFAVAAVMLVRMRTVVTPEYLRVTILPVPRRTFPIAEITRCEVITYRPVRDYGGWGWRWSRRGWAFTMRGNRGVMVHRTRRKSFLVGSQRPEELAAALHSAGNLRQGPPPEA